MRTRTFALAAVIALAASTLPFAAQEEIDPDINAKIRQAETAPSPLMRTPQGPEAPTSAGQGAGGRGPQRLGPTPAELDAYLNGVKDKVRNAAVLVGKPIFVPVNLNAPQPRLSDIDARCRYAPDADKDPA